MKGVYTSMKSIQRIMLLAALVIFSFSAFSLAAEFTIVNNVMELPTEPVPESAPAVTEGEGVVGLELTRGPGIQPAPLTNGFSSDSWDMPDASREKALEVGSFYQFGLQVEEGYSASVDSIGLWLRRTAVNAPMNFELQASLDGFATPGITVAQFNYFGRTSGDALFPNPHD